MKTICFYHNADLDGIASAAIVKLAIPDCEFRGVNYNDKPGDIPPDVSHIVIVDFSWDMDILYDLHNLPHISKITWIDHHKTAIEKVIGWDWDKFKMPNLTHALTIERAACELTWKHFFPKKKMPVSIHLLGIYDTWRIPEKPSELDYITASAWENITLPFQYAVRSKTMHPDTFPRELLSGDSEIAHYLYDGSAILRYINQQNKILATAAFERNVEGYRAIVLNQGKINSMAFDHVYDPELHDIMVAYSFNGKFFRVSFYTGKDSVDVSRIAQKFEGGGHRAAAGCQISNIEMLWETGIS